MDSDALAEILSQDPVTASVFRGVFASDELPLHFSRFPSALICNTDKADLPGTHWVAMYFEERGEGEYFDSFGLPPWVDSICCFLNRQAQKKWLYNNVQLQSPKFDACEPIACFI